MYVYIYTQNSTSKLELWKSFFLPIDRFATRLNVNMSLSHGCHGTFQLRTSLEKAGFGGGLVGPASPMGREFHHNYGWVLFGT